jgi:hypothetical protein
MRRYFPLHGIIFGPFPHEPKYNIGRHPAAALQLVAASRTVGYKSPPYTTLLLDISSHIPGSVPETFFLNLMKKAHLG